MGRLARGRTGEGIGTGVGRGREGGRKEKPKESKTQIHESELDEVD